jgi:gas vesicle protein
VREIVGFVMGAAAGAAGALFVSSAEGKALLQRLREEAQPEVDRATTEWEPVLNEVARAVRLAAREVETATADLRSRLADLAAAPPADDDPAAVDAGPDGALREDARPGADPEPGSVAADQEPSPGADPEPRAVAAEEEPSPGA